MKWKYISVHGLLSGALAAIAASIYLIIYQQAFEVDYRSVMNELSIFSSCVLSTLLMALCYSLCFKHKKRNLLGVVNLFIAVLSFASIIGPLSFALPLSVESPELFPGLAIPMHFFPALAFLVTFPFFKIE